MRNKLWLWHVPLAAAAFSMLLPLAFMFSTALSEPGKAFQTGDTLLSLVWPATWHWENFLEVWSKVSFLRYYLNSLFVAIVITAGQGFTSACAAYAFSRLRWRGRDQVFLLYLATMMVPHSVTMLPNFLTMRVMPDVLTHLLPFVDWPAFRYLGSGAGAPPLGRLAGLDSYFALITPGLFSAYGTFLLRQFMLALPKELEEAARMDGCGYWKTFTVVILPLSKPALATLAVFAFMGAWGAFLWPLVTINLDALRTLPLGLQAFQGQYATEWHLLMAAAILMLLPVVLIFVFCQRYFVSGLTLGGVKG